MPFWFPSGPRHGAQEASKIALENHGKFDAILGAQIAASSLQNSVKNGSRNLKKT